MDVEKFNNKLKTKVALAKGYEKSKEIDSAIKIWLEISEMTLTFSKSRNIDTSFKNMLINRTKDIVAHIKNLKAGQIEKPLFEEEIYSQEQEIQKNLTTEISESDKSASHTEEIKENTQNQSIVKNDITIIEESEFKNLPKGFKEIQPEEFKIVTPHDKDYVKKHLSKEISSDLFKQQKESNSSQKRLDFEQEENKQLICFACGYDKNPKNTKTCKSCGTKLY